MNLFPHPDCNAIRARGQNLLRAAEACLESGQVGSLAGVVAELRRLETAHGLTAVVGPAPSWLGRYDAVIQAWKEARDDR